MVCYATGSTSCQTSTEDEHPCPYQSEINNDDSDYCTCCDECEYECAQEI